ncbi:MAG: 5-formyltetrahydrofolate cyclo-ligase [Lachnospiraceae bacterium]|nr:5-formyltetrahydrofolate cyclo-ligase [Lachnospiraceae bacterium]
MTKKEIRDRVNERLTALSGEECMEKSAAILKRLGLRDEYLRAWKVALYASGTREVITYPMIARSRQLDKGVAFPAITDREKKEMVFRYVLSVSDLKCGTFGIPEPAENATVMEQPDVVIVPLVAFDEKKNRIGHGMGYYDRYLAAHPDAFTIGLAFSCQRTDAIPAEPTDVALDLIITEDTVYV